MVHSSLYELIELDLSGSGQGWGALAFLQGWKERAINRQYTSLRASFLATQVAFSSKEVREVMKTCHGDFHGNWKEQRF